MNLFCNGQVTTTTVQSAINWRTKNPEQIYCCSGRRRRSGRRRSRRRRSRCGWKIQCSANRFCQIFLFLNYLQCSVTRWQNYF